MEIQNCMPVSHTHTRLEWFPPGTGLKSKGVAPWGG